MAFPTPAGPAMQVELRMSCQELGGADWLSKADPMVIVLTHNPNAGPNQPHYTEYGRTEYIKNTTSPQFMRAIEITYHFELVQKLKFEVCDYDGEKSKPDHLGYIECTLAEIVTSQTTSIDHKFTRPLNKPAKGTITIRAEEVSRNTEMLELKFSARGLDKKDLFGKSDPYLEFSRSNQDGSFTPVHKIPHILKTLNPHWPVFKVEAAKLCGNDPSRRVRVQCFDYDEASDNDLIGEFFTSVQEMSEVANGGKKEWAAINPEKTKKKNYDNSGTIYLEGFKSYCVHSFLEYVFAGCQINFTVGIDFTGSNGDPSHPQSLHYIDPTHPNQYTQALWAVGGICQEYDSDKLFPAFGFGGKIGDKVSHEFPLNGVWENPYCGGIQGVMQAYHQSLKTVRLYGPTNAAPIINHVARFAEQAAKNPTAQNYFVLLLLTDGALSDMLDTKRAIIRASRFPMSIIIVGVGGADFAAMKELDADNKKLQVGNEVAERDIVQFVPFRDFAHTSPAMLASAVLAEVPSQLTQYFFNKGIAPLNVRSPGN